MRPCALGKSSLSIERVNGTYDMTNLVRVSVGHNITLNRMADWAVTARQHMEHGEEQVHTVHILSSDTIPAKYISISGSITSRMDLSIFIMESYAVLSFRFRVIITTIVKIGPSILTYGCIIFVSV